MYITWKDLIGKEILAYRGFSGSLSFILFNDGASFLKLEEQDSYDYHDCSSSARLIEVMQNRVQWKDLLDKKPPYTETSQDNMKYGF